MSEKNSKNIRTSSRKVSKIEGKTFASAGRYSRMKEGSDDEILDDHRIQAIRDAARASDPRIGIYSSAKTANLFGDGNLGYADIQDSNNPATLFNFEFGNDAMEMPSSRPEELRYYRLAYDRDCIVGRAIDMHTELPLSKMVLEKPKCSNEDFADYVYDFFTGLVNSTKMFQTLIDAVREYWAVGEAFIFIEEYQDISPCPEAKKQIEKGKRGTGGGRPAGSEPTKESEGAPLGGTSGDILDFLGPKKKAAWLNKRANVIREIEEGGIDFNPDDDPDSLNKGIKQGRLKLAKVIHRSNLPISVVAAPEDAGSPPPADAAGGPSMDEGAPLGDSGLDGISDGDGGDLGEGPDGVEDGLDGGMDMPMGGGGGFGGGGMSMEDGSSDVRDAIGVGSSTSSQREVMEMKHYLRLLEKQKALLEELREMRESKKQEVELFGHVFNKNYDGFDRIQTIEAEKIEIKTDGVNPDGPTIYYKPPEALKQAYMDDPDLSAYIKAMIQEEGSVPLNTDPFAGSYVIHFARKKTGSELHGRSILQRALTTIIYREKLRQVQNTLISRNMTPKTMVIAPDIPPAELMALRAHIDEAKNDPDYSVVLNYEARWDEIGSEGRILSLDAEYAHTDRNLAIGLGFSPDLLTGEGMFSGNRTALQLMEVSYTQFRDILTGIIEDQIFRPVAMKKGFYEMDRYGRPRWIYPKVSFSRMALRDEGDTYSNLFNLYQKGSLDISTLLEFMNVDPSAEKRKLEDSLFTVNDSKFSQVLDTVYGSIGDAILQKSDIMKRILKGLTLDEVDKIDEDSGPEGSGQGMS